MTRKITIAKCLDNSSKFLNEAFDSSMGTQRASLGEFKKFCLALTTVGLPNLIAFDLVTVSPMSSIYGNIAYVQYLKGTDKGESAAGDVTNNIWQLGEMDSNYTAQSVVESITSTSAAMALAFASAVKGAFTVITVGGTVVEFLPGNHHYTEAELATKAVKDVKIIASDGTVTFADLDSDGKVPQASLVANGKVAYV